MTSFAIEPIYGSILVAGLVAAATFAVIAWVTPPTEDVSQRRCLVALRSLAALALLLAIFRPAFLRTDNRPADASLMVAVDTSKSMTLPDGDGSDRWTTQVNAWQALATGLEQLDQSLTVKLLAYDADARALPGAEATALDNQQPSGDSTDLAAAALAMISAAEGQPIAGVVLMGDGTQTAPIQGTGAQRVVETLNSLGVPFWAVPIGPAAGQSASRDVAIEALPESFKLFAGNEIDVDFQVQTRGLAGVDVPIKVSWVDEAGAVSEVAVRQFRSGKASDVGSMSIPVTAPQPGTYQLRVEAPPQEGELVTVNNTQIAFVDVRDGGGRILYLEGQIREEQTRLTRTLRRFQDLDLTYRWIPTDTAKSWPLQLDQLLRPGRFDVYIIGDLDAGALGQDQLAQLSEAVAAGAGLVTLGGYQAYGAGGYATSPLADVLPVQLDGSRRRDPTKPIDDRTGHLKGPVVIELARNHPITDLGGDVQAAWRSLPPQLGANALVGPKAAPGVQVLLQSPQQAPLMVVGEYGKGRTASIAFDSTYRWRRGGRGDVHRRFWRQLILWLLSREVSGGDKIRIAIDSQRFDLKKPPNFTAMIDSLDQAAGPVELLAEILAPDDRAVNVPTSSDGDATAVSISGAIPELSPGIYRLRVRAADPNSKIEPDEVAFQVVDQSRELSRPMADPVYLRQLAALTTEHGGAAYDPDQIAELVDVISKRRQRAETAIVEKFRLGDGPLSGWIVFLLFAIPLCGEWYLRRRWGIA